MKTNLQQPSLEALKASYAEADEHGKALLEKLYGTAPFAPDPLDALMTFDDVIKATGADPADYQFAPTNNQNVIAGNNLAMWLLIVFAFNGNQDADWSDSNQPKYFPYGEFSPGSGWSFDDCALWYSITLVGARQAFLNREHVKIAVERFGAIFKLAYQFNN